MDVKFGPAGCTRFDASGSQRARTAILAITGVRAVDALVADALTRTARPAQMLGARVVLTGIRPEVARALPELGADLTVGIEDSDAPVLGG